MQNDRIGRLHVCNFHNRFAKLDFLMLYLRNIAKNLPSGDGRQNILRLYLFRYYKLDRLSGNAGIGNGRLLVGTAHIDEVAFVIIVGNGNIGLCAAGLYGDLIRYGCVAGCGIGNSLARSDAKYNDDDEYNAYNGEKSYYDLGGLLVFHR